MLVCRGEVRESGLTGLTRNQVSLTAPGVRIPPSPPPSLHIERFSAKFAENRHISGQFASLAAPETCAFELHRENFGVLSLIRISLVPRENTADLSKRDGRKERQVPRALKMAFRRPSL